MEAVPGHFYAPSGARRSWSNPGCSGDVHDGSKLETR